MLTPTFKNKREILKRTFEAELEALFQQLKKKGFGNTVMCTAAPREAGRFPHRSKIFSRGKIQAAWRCRVGSTALGLCRDACWQHHRCTQPHQVKRQADPGPVQG